jgi:hypothetical protein
MRLRVLSAAVAAADPATQPQQAPSAPSATNDQQHGAQQDQQRKLSQEEKQAVDAEMRRVAGEIDTMVEEVCREVFLEEGVQILAKSGVSGPLAGTPAEGRGSPQATAARLAAVVRTTVAARIDGLNANFLAALDQYLDLCAEREWDQLTHVLQVLHAEVMRQVTQRLPPAVQARDIAVCQLSMCAQFASGQLTAATRMDVATASAAGGSWQKWVLAAAHVDAAAHHLAVLTNHKVLQMVLDLVSRESRLAVLRAAAAGGAEGPDGVPACGLEPLLLATGQLLDDMEGHQVVPDRRLLARLCLVRHSPKARPQPVGLCQGLRKGLLFSIR